MFKLRFSFCTLKNSFLVPLNIHSNFSSSASKKDSITTMLKESANWIPKRCESVHFILCQIYFWYINGKFGDCCYVPLKRHNEIHFHAHAYIFTPEKKSLVSALCSSWSLAVACHHLSHFHFLIFILFFALCLSSLLLLLFIACIPPYQRVALILLESEVFFSVFVARAIQFDVKWQMAKLKFRNGNIIGMYLMCMWHVLMDSV